MKKILIAIVAVFAMSCVACTNGAGADSETTTDSTEVVVDSLGVDSLAVDTVAVDSLGI
jgi:predicted small secreted protein